MSIGDFYPMLQFRFNPSQLQLTNVGTSRTGSTTNGSNQVNGTMNAFWFILGDAMVGLFYSNVNLTGTGNDTFHLTWTNNWPNGIKTPLRYYSSLKGRVGANPNANTIDAHEGQGHLDFIVNNSWGNQLDNQSAGLVIFKHDS